VLRAALVAEKICRVDRSDLKTIENPYITASSATIQAVAGTYSVNALTTTDDALSVDDEVVNATHVFQFEMNTAAFDLVADFLDDLMYQTAKKIDQFVLNKVLSQATGTYSTPAGGFTTSSNIVTIMGNLVSKWGGYASGVATDPFLVIENTDLVGFAQAQVASGFSYADAALNNGFMGNYMGVKIYVVRSGTFTTATLGTLSATNSGHRLAGISNLATFASPRGVFYEEKAVTGKLGKEVVASGQVGAKVWTPHAGLFINITIA
jgi:hypothetical protein